MVIEKLTLDGLPGRNRSSSAWSVVGGAAMSKRKLYSVPQRRALAFWFCENVCVLQRSRELRPEQRNELEKTIDRLSAVEGDYSVN